MNKDQFLTKLNALLKKIPPEERKDMLQDFEEHFAIGLEEGKTEEQIAKSLGSPQQIARDLIATYRVEQVEETTTTANVFRAVWAVIGLGFFNLVVVLGPFIALASLIFAGWVVSFSFTVSPLLVVINTVIYPASFQLFDLFFSIGLTGLGLLIGLGMYYATRAVTSGFIRYLKYNVRIVKGGMKGA